MYSERGARRQNFIAMVFAVAIHVAIGLFLLVTLNLSDTPHPEEGMLAESIPAEMVDEVAIREELERLSELERQRQRVEAERQAKLAQAEREAREAEERRRKEIQRQREAEQAKQKAAEE
ncbi:MAG: hypothetical protein KDJ34_00360, partial [Candidatus Competibacteraceae bacterium]|nr:hypothetical protein [Candidatus Competibacteraceae bacterium]